MTLVSARTIAYAGIILLTSICSYIIHLGSQVCSSSINFQEDMSASVAHILLAMEKEPTSIASREANANRAIAKS